MTWLQCAIGGVPPECPFPWHGGMGGFLSWRCCVQPTNLHILGAHIYSMSKIIYDCLVNRFSNTTNPLFKASWSNNFICPWSVFVGSQNANFSSCNFLFMNVNSLWKYDDDSILCSWGAWIPSICDTLSVKAPISSVPPLRTGWCRL